MLRVIRFGRHGMLEDPTGQIVTYKTANGSALREVTGFYRREFPACMMLKVRSFNREIVEEVAAGAVHLVLPDEADYQSGD